MGQSPLIGQYPRFATGASAGGVIVIDSGGYFTGTTLEEILAEIGAGTAGAYLTKTGGEVHTIDTSHATLNGTATFDLANGNVHPGTLTADTTITTVGWPATGTRGWLQFKITGDGASTPTFTGVTWDGQDPPGIIGAGEVLHGALWSDDGGTVIWGGYRGAVTASDGMVPYYIASGDTFTVPIYKQALKAMPITVDGTLVVDGYLIEVN